MNDRKESIVFKQQAYAGVMQDKYPPVRIYAASREPATAGKAADIQASGGTNIPRVQNEAVFPAPDRPKHHGSETRQTIQIAGRVKPAIKSEVTRVARLKGWTESKTVASLVEQALAANLAESFAVMLKATIQDAVTKQMRQENSRAGKLAL